MSQILKLDAGGSVKSKKNQELELIQQNRLRIQDAYASGQMSEDVKAKLDMIAENAKDYLQADPLTNKNARRFQLSLTQRMVDILDGKEGFENFNTDIATKNYWGKYDDDEINNITNELVKKTVSGSSSTTAQNLPVQSTPEDSHYVYSWTSGTDYSLLTPKTTTQEKIKLFAGDLLNTINNLQTAQTAGKTIHGFEGDLSLLEDKKAKLLNILSNPNLDDNTAFTSLLSVIQDGNLGVDPSTFKNVFSEFYGESSEEETKKEEEPVIYRDQNLTDYLTNKGLHLLKTEDGKILLADQSGSRAAANFAELDPTSSYYQWGFFIDPNTGEILGADNLVQNPEFTLKFAEQWQALIPKIKEEYKSKFPIQDYTLLGGKKGIDFSNYIPGTDIKFIDTSDFDYDADTTTAWLPFNQWFENWDDIKNTFNYKGLADVTTSGTNPQNQYARAMGFDPDLDLSEVISKRSLNDLKSEIIKLNPKSESTLTRGTNHKNFSTSLVEYVTKSICSADPNNPNKDVYSAQLKNDYTNASRSHKTFKTEGNALMARMKSNPEILNQVLALCIKYSRNVEDRKSLIAAYKAFNKSSQTTVNKEGGVLFLQGGGSTWADDYWNSFGASAETKSNNSTTTSISDRPEISEEDAKKGLTFALAGALGDFALMFDPEPYSSGALSAAVLGLNQAADHYLQASKGLKWLDAGIDTLGGIASVIPLIGNATQYPKLAYKLAKISKTLGVTGMTLAPIALGLGIKNASDLQLLSKFISNPSELSKEEMTDLVRLATTAISSTRTAQGIARSNRGVVQKSGNPEFIQTRDNSGNLSFLKINKDAQLKANTDRDEALKKLHFWNLQKKLKVNEEYAKAITPEEFTPVTNIKGNPKYDFDYTVNPEKANERIGFMMGHPYRASSQIDPSNILAYDPNKSFENIVKNWWGNTSLVPSSFKTYPILNRTSIPIKGKPVQVISIPDKSASDAIRQFKLKQLNPSEIPSEVKKIVGKNTVVYLDPSGAYVYVQSSSTKASPVSTKQQGGKLDRLQQFINNK